MGLLTSRLFRYRAVFALLDTQATEEGPPGQHNVFREPKLSYDAAGNRIDGRKEREVTVRCQVETGTFETRNLTAFGNDPNTSLVIVSRRAFLQEAGVLDDKGQCLIGQGARLVRVEDLVGNLQDSYERRDDTGQLISGVYVKEATPSDYGFNGGRDLFVFKLEDRALAPQAG